ncbi:MAG: hypothetical protein R3B13_36975 [Polyangiaceae bacterium]
MTRLRGISLIGCIALLGLASAASAEGKPWSADTPVNVRVNQHTFDRLIVKAKACEVSVKIKFDAPAKAYDSGAKRRNHYLFRARIKLKDGKELVSEVFRSSSASRRTYSQTFDTSGDGCWSEAKNPPMDLNVVACRGWNCKVPDFE